MIKPLPTRYYVDAAGSYLGGFAGCAVTRKKVIETVPVEQDVPVTRKVMRPGVAMENGKAVMRMREAEERVVDLVPVVDADGAPLLKDGKPVMHRRARTKRMKVGVRHIYSNVDEEILPSLPAGAVEVPSPPPHAEGWRWDGKQWVEVVRFAT